MKKTTIEIGKIGQRIKLKFGLILESESDIKNPTNKLVTKYKYGENEYITFKPRPFVTLDINSTKSRQEEWNPFMTVTFNKQFLFLFIMKLKKFIKLYTDNEDMYYYDGESLKMDLKVINEKKIELRLSVNGKQIVMIPAVVPEEENSSTEYEGCVLFINTADNFVLLTYDEMQYLLHELDHIDMTLLATQVMLLAESHDDDTAEEIQQKTVSEETVVELNKTPVKMVKPNNIPDI